MRATDFIVEYKLTAPESELAKKLFRIDDLSYNSIDSLMKKIAFKNGITPKELHKLFVRRFGAIPDDWIEERRSLKEDVEDQHDMIHKFTKWACEILKIEDCPKIHFSHDVEQASVGHHTGRYNPETRELWVYMGPKKKTRLTIDILRTVFHELTHVKQHEMDRIKPGSSYPGSPIEREADMMAGKYMKIYGKDHPEIFIE